MILVGYTRGDLFNMSQFNNSIQRNSRNRSYQRPNQNVTSNNPTLNIEFYPQSLHKYPLHKYPLHQSNNFEKCPVPITFRHLGELVDDMMTEFDGMVNRFAKLIYTDENKRIYKKVCFILAELKLERSLRSVHWKETEHLRKFDCNSELYEYSREISRLPYPLALYLDSIGCFKNKSMNYVPVPAITDNHIADACYSCMPYKFTDILQQLANGVEIEKVPVAAQESLKSLPAIEWMIIENDEGVETHIKLAPESVRFWLKSETDQRIEVNCTSADLDIFDRMNLRLIQFPEILTSHYRMDNGEGNASQLVRFVKNEEHSKEIHWYTMRGVPEEYEKIGILFGFGHFDEPIQPSIAIGDPSSAHTNGHEFSSESLKKAFFDPFEDALITYYIDHLDSD